MSQWIFYNLRICKIFFANTRKVHILKWHMDLFSQALFGWDYFAKIEAKMFAKQAQNSLKCSRINFSQIWQTLQQILLLENLVLLLIYWQNIITWGECYSIQEVSRRILVVFSAILNVLAILWGVCKFCANYFAKELLL